MRGKERKKEIERENEFSFFLFLQKLFFKIALFFYFFTELDVLNINSITELGTELPKCDHCDGGSIIRMKRDIFLDNVL